MDNQRIHNPSREEWLSRLSESRDPLDILKSYRMLMQNVYETLVGLTECDESEAITDELLRIEDYDSQIREFLYEETATNFARHDKRVGGIIFDSFPPGLRLIVTEEGFTLEHIPLWMLGPSGTKKLHPLYHGGRPFIRKRQLWHSLIGHLKGDFLATTSKLDWRDKGPIPDPLPPYSHMIIQFRSASPSAIRDMDNYTSVVSVLTNALVSHGLILSDHPSRFALSLTWEQAEFEDHPKAKIRVVWSRERVPHSGSML